MLAKQSEHAAETQLRHRVWLKYPAACHVRPNLLLPSMAEVVVSTHLLTILPCRVLRNINSEERKD